MYRKHLIITVSRIFFIDAVIDKWSDALTALTNVHNVKHSLSLKCIYICVQYYRVFSRIYYLYYKYGKGLYTTYHYQGFPVI